MHQVMWRVQAGLLSPLLHVFMKQEWFRKAWQCQATRVELVDLIPPG